MAKEKVENKGIGDVIKDLDKSYGKGSIVSGLSDGPDLGVISTGSLGLDIATGIGGIPKGKIIEIFGWESSGKSTLTQTIVGNYQKESDKVAVFCDGENSIDPDYAMNLGVDMDDLLIVQLDDSGGEGAFDKVEKLVRTGEVGMVVFDSYNSLQPKKVMEGEYGASNIGLHARLMGQSLVKNNLLAIKYGCTFLYLGQVRQQIGVMYGSPDIPQGGNALKFYAHMRFKVTRSTTEANSIMDGDDKLGNLTTVEIIKNKLAPPFKKAKFNIRYGEGIDRYEEIMRLGSETEIFKKWGQTITHGEDKYSLEEFDKMLRDNDEFKISIENQIRKVLI